MKNKILVIIICIIILLSLDNFAYSEGSNVDFSTIFENHGLVRLIIDTETGSILYANQAAVEFYGYSKDELLSMKIQNINTLDPIQIRKEMEAAYREERNYFIFEHRLSNGDIKNVEVHSYPVIQEGKEILYSVVIDITSRVLLEKKLARMNKISRYFIIAVVILFCILIIKLFISREKYKKIANYDILTGAYSRLYLEKIIHEGLKGHNSNQIEYAVILIDIDNFKYINDCFGHSVGDRVLKKVVEITKLHIRREDMIIRYGGDEFVIILNNRSLSAANTIMERISEKLKNKEEFEFEIEFSYGIELMSNRNEIYNAIKIADNKMYTTKKMKTNQL